MRTATAPYRERRIAERRHAEANPLPVDKDHEGVLPLTALLRTLAVFLLTGIAALYAGQPGGAVICAIAATIASLSWTFRQIKASRNVF